MTVLSIILGILMIFAGFSLMCTPLATFLSAGYFLGIMMFVYGIAGIIRAFQKKNYIFETVFSILALIVGVIALIRPGSTLILDAMIVYFAAFWFVLRGAFDVTIGIKLKGVTSSWIWILLLGILSIVIGVYSFAHPTVMALATGILIGIYCVEAGIDMIITGINIKRIMNATETVAAAAEEAAAESVSQPAEEKAEAAVETSSEDDAK